MLALLGVPLEKIYLWLQFNQSFRPMKRNLGKSKVLELSFFTH